ncbi:Lysophosphatidylcholine acyltransferase 1 [Eumeta japonica]|uniref:Lysophosphatidylcholine acyltransferase 1 n=1 Tax=Eumeta variegata TaxID=151549 RepID=A0A4C1T2Q4_EUMVA|nr:Lysophosphatidylcholine acyltransferase 1 [Eumeta japonica]
MQSLGARSHRELGSCGLWGHFLLAQIYQAFTGLVEIVDRRSRPGVVIHLAPPRGHVALGVPVLDYSYDDCRLIARAKQLGVPAAQRLVEVARLRHALGLEASQQELQLVSLGGSRWLDRGEFARRLCVEETENANRLYEIFVQKQCNLLYWPDYLLCAVFLMMQHAPLAHLLSYAFKIYDSSSTGRVSAADFEEMSSRCLGLYQEDAHRTFRHVDIHETGYIAYANRKADEHASHEKAGYTATMDTRNFKEVTSPMRCRPLG